MYCNCMVAMDDESAYNIRKRKVEITSFYWLPVQCSGDVCWVQGRSQKVPKGGAKSGKG